MRTMEANDFENVLKKTVAPNNIRGHLLNNGEIKLAFFMSHSQNLTLSNNFFVEQMHDLVFILGSNEERMFAHKLFLISSSSVFHNILSSQVDTVLNVKINQISKNTMIEICRFAYTENVNLTQYNMFDVLNAASKFEMKFLMEKVVDFVTKQLNENSVFSILESNQRHHNLHINKKCFEFIEKNHRKCVKDKNWLKVTSDLMRLILQNCKIPEASLKEGLQVWKKSHGDAVDDLDEMMSLVSLDKVDSDTESVVSATTGRARRQRRYGKHKTVYTRSQQLTDPSASKQNVTKRPQPYGSRVQPQPMRIRGLVFGLQGVKDRRNFKYANLDLKAVNQNIFIEEIEFVYNLFATDTEFEVKILITENSNRKQIYSDNVKMTESLKNYKLNRTCMIPAGQKAWIRIEFPQSEYRLTFTNFFVPPISGRDLELSVDPSVNSYAQIIEFVFYGK